MKFIFLILIFISSNFVSDKVNANESLIQSLKKEGKLIFIRHAFAPGSGDPSNFNIKNCNTQRNLNDEGRNQAKLIGLFFKKNTIPIEGVFSSEWCRCRETASIAFEGNYKTKNFLNSFYEKKFLQNKDTQIKDLKKYIMSWDGIKNLVFITHYVVISEVLDVYPSSGEIVISDKNYNVIGNLQFNF